MARLVATLLVLATSVGAQTLPNPSFEADSFAVYPGYISGNGTITGWTSSNNERAGLKPAAGAPFADNGAIPNPGVALRGPGSTPGGAWSYSGIVLRTTGSVTPATVGCRNPSRASVSTFSAWMTGRVSSAARPRRTSSSTRRRTCRA